MVLIENSTDGAEATIAGAGAQQKVVPKRSLNVVVTRAYVCHQAEKRRTPCGTLSITEFAEHLSTHMQLVVPRQQLIEPPPAQMPPPVQMLRFTNKFPAEIFTNRLIELQIELVNIESGLICSTGEPVSPLQVEIFVTRGNFPSNEKKLRKCKPLSPRNKATMPLLVQVAGTKTARRGCSFKNKFVTKLHNGRAVVKVKITDNSSWVRSKMFKLVARVKGRRIKEALSEAFAVKESKLEGRKADVPSPTDPTSKLINVGKTYYKILQAMEINTVHDFLNKLKSDPEGLKRKLGMQKMKWESTIEHAMQCRVSPEEVNIFNSGENETGDSVTSNLGIQQEYMEGTNLINMCMGQQRDIEARSGSNRMEHLQPISSLNGNNGSRMTMDKNVYCNQGYHISIDGYISSEIPGLESGTLPNPMPEFQLRNMDMGNQVAPESKLVSGQTERFPSNTSFNGTISSNMCADEIFEGQLEQTTAITSFGRIESNQWDDDIDCSAFLDGGSTIMHCENEIFHKIFDAN